MSVINESKSKEEIKQLLLDEARLSLELSEKGIFYNAEDIKRIRDKTGANSPFGRRDGLPGFHLPHGNNASGKFSKYTPYSIAVR